MTVTDEKVDVGSSQQLQEAEIVEPAKKKGNKKKIVAVIVAVVVVAAIGFTVWHEQPAFCNAICHTPMDSYVEGYASYDNTKNVTVHKRSGLTCLKCHEPKIDEQIAEGISWMAGDYAYAAETGKLISRSEEFATTEFCLQKGCHAVSTLGELSELTEDRVWNPHDFSEHGVTICGDCHKVHDQSVLVCSECHYQAADDVPKDWTSIPYRETR